MREPTTGVILRRLAGAILYFLSREAGEARRG
jgi:hypothetical protein